jgi:decaprenylphospho-beta-D-ribofuranose 2-oxidase
MPDTAPPANPPWSAETLQFKSFDGGVSAQVQCWSPDRCRFWDVSRGAVGISRGAGLSYAPASFSTAADTVEHRHFNRLLDFDASARILEVETGTTLGQIYQFAGPRGLFLPVQPGHPRITIGGCIAADVHGKNQFRDGTFLSTVESLRLFHPAYGILDLSRSQNPELFLLTCGGYGLTGNILTARLRLSTMPSSHVRLTTTPLEKIEDLLDTLSRAADHNDLLYSWHDFAARGKGFGAGVVISGRFEAGGQALATRPGFSDTCTLDSATRGLPFRFFNRLTTPLFNRIYHASMRRGSPTRLVPVPKFMFPVGNKELYFHLFGKQGFHEYQIVVEGGRFNALIATLRKRLEAQPVAVTLASAKLFRGKRDLLRFTGDGVCLALDFPRDRAGAAFAAFLDEQTIAHAAWPNIIKDSRLTQRVVAASYPEYELFRDRLRTFDPQRLYRSVLSERLTL